MVSLEGCQQSPCSVEAEAKSQLQKCLQLRIDTVGSLTCSPAIVSVFDLQDKGWVPLHPPLPHQAMLFLSIVQLPGVGLDSQVESSNVSAGEDFGGFLADLHYS